MHCSQYYSIEKIFFIELKTFLFSLDYNSKLYLYNIPNNYRNLNFNTLYDIFMPYQYKDKIILERGLLEILQYTYTYI